MQAKFTKAYICAKLHNSMSFLRLLPLLLCFSSVAQVNLYIEDKTESGFLLGINGYVQNTDPVQKLALSKLDTFPFIVRVELEPRVSFSKKMHFHESGSYHYIITTNSRDELQLRYRGKIKEIPAAVITMEVQATLPLESLASRSDKSTQPKSPLPPPKEDPRPKLAKPDSAKVTIAATTKPGKKPAPLPEVKTDTTGEVSTTTAHISSTQPDTNSTPKIVTTSPPESPKPTPKKSTFEDFKNELKATEFEFEKLSKSQDFAKEHDFTTEELKQVLLVMKYDNTRLELLRSLSAQLQKMEEPKLLKQTLEYEISKQQFNDILEP